MGQNESQQNIALIDRYIAEAGEDEESVSDFFAIMAVRLGIKKAFLFQTDRADITPLTWRFIRELGLHVTALEAPHVRGQPASERAIFLSTQPLPRYNRQLTHNDIGDILGFQCVGDFGRRGVFINISDADERYHVVAEKCTPVHARRPETVRYYQNMARRLNEAFAPKYVFRLTIDRQNIPL